MSKHESAEFLLVMDSAVRGIARGQGFREGGIHRWVRTTVVVAAIHASPFHAAGQASDVVAWQPRETVSVGGLTGEVALNWVNDLAVGPDGRVYVAQALLPEVWVFDRDGRFERVLGGAGQGPGEFTMFVEMLGWKGDTLWAGDLNGINYYDKEGNPTRRTEWRAVEAAEGSVMVPGVPFAGGGYLPRRRINRPSSYGATATSAVRSYSGNGTSADTLAVLAGWGEQFVELDWSRSIRAYEAHPLAYRYLEGPGAVLKQAVGPDGSCFVLIDGGDVGPDRGEFDILRISSSGDTLSVRTVAYSPRPVGREERAEITDWFAGHLAGDYIEGPLVGISPQEAERRRRMARAGLTFPAFHPPVRHVIVGRDDSIWLLREWQPDGSDLWEVYDDRGEPLASVRFHQGRRAPAPWDVGVRLLSVSAEEVWGVTVDEMDVPTIRRFRLERPGG